MMQTAEQGRPRGVAGGPGTELAAGGTDGSLGRRHDEPPFLGVSATHTPEVSTAYRSGSAGTP